MPQVRTRQIGKRLSIKIQGGLGAIIRFNGIDNALEASSVVTSSTEASNHAVRFPVFTTSPSSLVLRGLSRETAKRLTSWGWDERNRNRKAIEVSLWDAIEKHLESIRRLKVRSYTFWLIGSLS
jgi:hypothetical protein